MDEKPRMIRLRSTVEGDLPLIAEIHRSAYSRDHFSSKFSKAMLVAYYGQFLELNRFCYCAVNDEDEVVGFIIAGYNTAKSVDLFTKSHFLSLVGYTAISPQEWLPKVTGFLDSKFRPGRPKSGKSSGAKLRLLSIATAATHQGLGYGTQMLQRFEEKVSENGADCYGLSVRTKNERAREFYLRNGFELEYETKKFAYLIRKLADTPGE